MVDLVLEIKDLVQLEHIMNRIKGLKTSHDVKRVSFNGQPQNPLNKVRGNCLRAVVQRVTRGSVTVEGIGLRN